MREWEKPSIMGLKLNETAGNPATTGNDSAIPDCVENAFEDVFGDHSGDCPTHS